VNWPISKISPTVDAYGTAEEASYLKEMAKSGFVRPNTRGKPGTIPLNTRVLLSIENGYESLARVVKNFKNGSVLVQHDDGMISHAYPYSVWLKQGRA
jgi:hypothetical protein